MILGGKTFSVIIIRCEGVDTSPEKCAADCSVLAIPGQKDSRMKSCMARATAMGRIQLLPIAELIQFSILAIDPAQQTANLIHNLSPPLGAMYCFT